MRLSNPIYTRTWTKYVSPIGAFFNQIAKLPTLQTLIGQNNQDELLLPMSSMSNGHAKNDIDDQSSMTSIRHPLRTFFSSILSPFRTTDSSLTSVHTRHSSPSKNSRHQRFHNRKSTDNNSIYHQIPHQMINDENNNTKQSDLSKNSSTIVDLSSIQNLHNDELIFGSQSLTRRHLIWMIFFTLIYFTWFIAIAGISILHVTVYIIFFLSYVASDRSRRFVLAIFIYLFYLLLYDALRLIPNYSVSKVHIRDVYYTEKRLFGIVSNGNLLTLNEYFRLNHQPILDVFTGICYLNWIPIPVAYSLYLYRYKSKRDYIDFALTFLLTNMLGFIIYYIIPAAPPWYVELYGFRMDIKAPGYPAGFLNFDQITGLKIFSSIYSKNANVFAAIPSLHAAYPLITVLYGSLSKKLWLHIGFVLFTLSVWFSAVYSRHHYVLDVLAGGTCAVTAYILYRLLSRVPTISRFLNGYSKII